MSADSLLIILLIGLVAGWLAGLIVQGTGFGLIADICIGIVGALIGSWLFPQIGHPYRRGHGRRHYRGDGRRGAAAPDPQARLQRRALVTR